MAVSVYPGSPWGKTTRHGRIEYRCDYVDSVTGRIINEVLYFASDPDATVLAGLAERMAEQVSSGPVLVLSAPPSGKTTVYTYCYDADGDPVSGVKIYVKLLKTTQSGSGAYTQTTLSSVSNGSGVASLLVPRGSHLRFQVKRADGPWVDFNGVDAETLQLPSFFGNV